ncbi:GMC oxidoreductase [Mucilaginibacter terrenus]|uniref:GMC oxidoreductase n=1 Tax=Mucilaginibacter terrenus TaxID=2482727 RepID=UPI001F39937A|nr:GMC oxidoreductase [Mucilaginibacter terrenus]
MIGSGPGGIILTLEYAKLNPDKTVLLVEYGSLKSEEKNALDDSIVIENITNHHTPYETTNKMFGGTTQTWGGRCVNYNPIDFQQRDIVGENCTWDLAFYHDALQYSEISAKYFECGEPVFNINSNINLKHSRIAENFTKGIVTDSEVERWSMPTRFGERYRDDIKLDHNIHLLSSFEARVFAKPNTSSMVETLEIRQVFTGELVTIKAGDYVIAAGAQESTRVLLRNVQLFSNLGFTPPSLGRYYQGHLSGKIASVKFYGNPKKTDFGFIVDKDGVYLRRRFQFTGETLQKHNLLNTAIWLDNPLYYDPSHGSGAMSFMYLAMITPVLGKKLAPPAIAQSVTKGKVFGVTKHIANVLRQFPSSLLTPASIFYKRYFSKRKLPGVFLYSPDNEYALHFHAEQQPVFSNLMELAGDGETMLIKYSLSDDDINSVIKVHEILDEYLRENKCGELIYWFKQDELKDAIRLMSKDGIHQSGTTRIASSAQKGVVNEDLRLWGTSNVYVCSSSVFPTSSQANPTFFLGVVAARLANFLTEKA